MDLIRACFEATISPKCIPTGRMDHTDQGKRRRGAIPRQNFTIHATRVQIITWPFQSYPPCDNAVPPEARDEVIQEIGGAGRIKGDDSYIYMRDNLNIDYAADLTKKKKYTPWSSSSY